MIDVVGKKPKGKLDYDHWLAEPGVLARVLQVTENCRSEKLWIRMRTVCDFQAVMYNSISMDMVVGPVAKVEKIEDQMEQFVDYARNFGVPQVIEYIELAEPKCRHSTCRNFYSIHLKI